MIQELDLEDAITKPRLALITELLLQLREELLKAGLISEGYVNRRVCELLDNCIDELYERTKETIND